MKRMVTLGVIGLGQVFMKKHLPVILGYPKQFRIKGVYTSSYKKFLDFRTQVKDVQYCKDMESLLKRQDIEAVIACCPIPQRFEILKRIIHHEKNFLTEKPLSHDALSAQYLLSHLQARKLQGMICENYRYVRSFHKLKKLITARSLGELLFVNVNAIWRFDRRNPYYKAWRIHPKGYQGILLDGGIHIISLLRYLFGDLKLRYRFLFSFNSAIGKVDTAILHLRLSSGVDVSVTLSYSLYDTDRSLLSAYFTRGNVKCNLKSVVVDDEKRGKRRYFYPGREYHAIYQEFYRYLTSSYEPSYGLQEAYQDLLSFEEVFLYTPRTKKMRIAEYYT